jgi:hypothetical protein
MGPPARSLAAEANGCFMVRVRHGPNRIQGCGARDAPDSGLPSDQSKRASAIGEQSHAIKLDTDIPIQGCVKTSARFRASLFRSLLRGFKAFRVEKIAKILLCSIVCKISPSFHTASVESGRRAHPGSTAEIEHSTLCRQKCRFPSAPPVVPCTYLPIASIVCSNDDAGTRKRPE